MSLEGLKIPSNIIGRLYKEVVVLETPTRTQPIVVPTPEVAVETPAVTQPNAPAAPLVYLGNNQQNIAILVNYPSDKHIAEAPLELLSKMLAACQLNLGSVAIINTAHQKVTYQKLQVQLQSTIVMMFGLDASSIALPMQFPLYKDQSFANVVYLQSNSLDEMLPNTNESKLLKSSLWASFKRIFNL